MKVAFLGLGIMGSRMATHLVNNDVNLTVWNRSPRPVESLSAIGAKGADTISAAVSDADIVMTMLANPEVVNTVALTHDGLLSHMKPGAIWVDSSTVDPIFSRKSAEQANAMSIRFLDAPVAGTKPQADNAELVFFVGGDDEVVSKVEPLFNVMGQKVMHLGPVGSGTSFKILVNALLGQSMLAFAETVALGTKMGLSREFLLNTLPKLPVIAPFTAAKAEMIRSSNFDAMFPLELMQKDLQLVSSTAYKYNQPLPQLNAAKELYMSAVQRGLGREDFAAVIKVLEEQN